MKKTINKPEVKVVKLQKMNVIATSDGGGTPGPGPHKASVNTATVIMQDFTVGGSGDSSNKIDGSKW